MPIEPIQKDTADIAAETLSGDVRDAILGQIRALQKPYARCSQDEQREVIEHAAKVANGLVRNAVEIIASHGRKVIHSTVEQITVKDGIKVVLKSANTEAALSELGNCIGKQVLIIISDASDFTGEKQEVKPEPDQQVIPLHVAKDNDPEDDSPTSKKKR